MDREHGVLELHYSFDVPHGWEKLTELIIHIANRNRDNRKFGKLKLLKILFHADFRAYNELGRPITGIQYRRFPYGPVGTDALNAIEQDEHLAFKETYYPEFPHAQIRVLATREATRLTELLGADELEIVEAEIRRMWDMSAEEVSSQSHGSAWGNVASFAPIPYESAFLAEPAEVGEADFAAIRDILPE